MQTPSQLLLLLACLCVCARLDHLQERYHTSVDIRLNQTEAQKHCQAHHVNLSSILTEADQQKIQSLGFTEPAWIGLVRGPQNWTWSNGSKPEYYNWNRDGDCAAVTTDGFWVDLSCQSAQPFICQTNDGEHKLNPEKMTWHNAKTYCEGLGQKLPTFKSVDTRLREWPDTPHWIGLHKHLRNWTWVDSKEGLNYTNWQTRLFCAFMASDGRWREDVCHNKHPFVCMDEQVLEVTADPRSWHEAKEECRRKNKQLVIIRNAGENARVRHKLPDSTGGFWIGLSSNPWKWPDGSTAIFKKWNDNQPNNGNDVCVMTMRGLWYDRPCSDQAPFFCLMKPLRLMVVTVAPSSWENALLHCRGQGGDLASIRNEDYQKQIRQVVWHAMTTHVWVGLRFLVREWLWMNGAHLAYHQWAAGKDQTCPLHHCGAVDRMTGYWVPVSCEEKLNFVCQLP